LILKKFQTGDREKLASLMEELQLLPKEMDPDVDEKAEEISQLLHLHGSRHWCKRFFNETCYKVRHGSNGKESAG
jgi:hypothetical protein